MTLSAMAGAKTIDDSDLTLEISKAISASLIKEYPKNDPAEVKKWAGFCATRIVTYTAILGIRDYAKMLSAMIWVESRYRSTVINGDSYGLGQVRRTYWNDFTAELRRLGKMPDGGEKDPEAQIAAAAGALRVMLDDSGGIAWFAVRKYNGSVKHGAKLHRWKVWMAYKAMYGVWP